MFRCLWFVLSLALVARTASAESRIDRGPWSGAVTTGGAIVKAKLRHEGYEAFLLVDPDPGFPAPRRIGPVVSDTNHANVVAFVVDQLRPETTYHYAIEIKGERETGKEGKFQTFHRGPFSFQFAFASCGRTGSTNASYEMIRRHDPLFFLCTGDLHYEDVRTNRVERFWHAYDKVLASPVQAALFRDVPLAYVWDDHDFCGNDSDDRAIGRSSARSAYDTYVPHYPLDFEEPEAPISQAFDVGRARFIVTDLRSQRDPSHLKESPSKTMLGMAQKEWLKRELTAANGKYPLIFWVSSVPWSGSTHTNFYWGVPTNHFGLVHGADLDLKSRPGHRPRVPLGVDSWAAYTTERREIADFIATNHIHGLILLHGDMHAVAADDGSNTDFTTARKGHGFPLFAAAPLDREWSLKGGPYSAGVYKPSKGEGCFGLVDVTDLGRELKVHFGGRNNEDQEVLSLDVTVQDSGTR